MQPTIWYVAVAERSNAQVCKTLYSWVQIPPATPEEREPCGKGSALLMRNTSKGCAGFDSQAFRQFLRPCSSEEERPPVTRKVGVS